MPTIFRNNNKSGHYACPLADKRYGFVGLTNLAMSANIYLHLPL